MQAKQEYIHNLKKVKLVIGNGFDLHCGLKTKYEDFFRSNQKKIEHIERCVTHIKNNLNFYLDFNRSSQKQYFEMFDFNGDISIWDYFFYLVSSKKDIDIDTIKWCDIERIMLEWFAEPETNIYNKKKYNNWLYVYKILNGKKLLNYDENFDIIAVIIYKYNDFNRFDSLVDFYHFLFNQLKRFEKVFGQYILKEYESLIISGNFNLKVISKRSNEVNKIINLICDSDNIVSIDSFNFGFIGIEKYRLFFHNINGNVDNPIFGIDSSAFLPPDPRYMFSKTNRRMELDMLEYESYEREEFDNVVIYGHSLTTSDYSYFFSLFDKLDIINLAKKSVIVFAYSIYDKEKEEEIKSDYRLAISNLFKEYSKYKGNSNYPNRLLDALTTQGKVLLYEI